MYKGRDVSRRWVLAESHDPPCCTGNQARLLPNYIHHAWMALPHDAGLALSMYGPLAVSATLAGGVRVNVQVETAYPFEEEVLLRIKLPGLAARPSSAAATAVFELHLRIPTWCSTPSLRVCGVAVLVAPNARGYHVIERHWRDGDLVELTLPMQPMLTSGVRAA